MANKDVQELLNACARAGWRVESGGKHWKVYPADITKPMITIPRSPSDWRALKNARAALRRAGLEV